MANSPARSVIDVGSVIDKYVIEALIGHGGMGAVFLARHRTLTDKRVAIKVLHAEIRDADIQARFKREAQIATRVNHPNIVEVHDFDVTPEGVPYLVLEYLEGQTLAQRIAQGPIPIEQLLSIVRQVGSALAAAHREGIVHRDLKPQNIFLVPTEVDGNMVEIAKVLDFGISKWRGSETVKTQESALLGTPQYMAPEQATGRHEKVDERTDVFALGAIVYEMLCGHPAFEGASIPEVVFKVVYEQPQPMAASVPDKIASAVRQAMAKPPEERFATVSDFVEGLTGTALSTFRPSMITKPSEGFASGSKKIANAAALGETVGSGDHAAAIAPVPPTAPTLPSVSSREAGVAATSAAPAAPAPAPGKKPTLWILLGLGAIAATAAIMYVVMKAPAHEPAPPPTTQPPARVAEVTPDAAVAAPPAPPTPPPPAPPPPVMTTQSPPAPPPKPPVQETKPAKVTKPTAKQEPANEDGDAAADDDDSVKETLNRAQGAFNNGELDLADRLANSAINQGGKGQRARGAMIKGLIACQKRDLENANQQLNRMAGYPRMRQRVIAACRQAGMTVR